MEATEKQEGNSEQKQQSGGDGDFFFSDGWLFKIKGTNLVRIANYRAEIISDMIRIEDDRVQDRILVLRIDLDGTQSTLSVAAGEFFSQKLPRRIMEAAGPKAITCGSSQDLRNAIQQLSVGPSEHKKVTSDIGFTGEGAYLAKGMLITPSGITLAPGVDVDLNTGKARKLRFENPDDSLKNLAAHLVADFLKLKPAHVMFPLMGHICLAPFSSRIYEITGKNKPALHLVGPSGAGKTFLGNLGMSFFGSFDDGVTSWTSTANAIEAEGYFFKDSLFLVNDFKASCIDWKSAVRILQNYADGSGRMRMKADASLHRPTYIRGLLLSTGEDFVAGSESVAARTILLRVPPEKNIESGERCRARKAEYAMFLPGLIQWVISDGNWEASFSDYVSKKISEYHAAAEFSNGLRVAANWALNAFGFNMIVQYFNRLGVIEQSEAKVMLEEYDSIAKGYLQVHAETFKAEDPAEVLFRVLGEKFATHSVSLLNDADSSKGKIIGKKHETSVFLFPSAVMEVLTAHSRSLGQKMPFGKDALRDALIKGGLLKRANQERWAKQIRGEGGRRVQAWEFDAETFRQLYEIECAATAQEEVGEKNRDLQVEK